MRLRITSIEPTKRFDRFYKSLPVNIQDEVKQVLKDLLKMPLPPSLRFEKLSGYSKPGIYTVHVTSNRSHKLSFELSGNTAKLRCVGTHKEIDRNP